MSSKKEDKGHDKKHLETPSTHLRTASPRASAAATNAVRGSHVHPAGAGSLHPAGNAGRRMAGSATGSQMDIHSLLSSASSASLISNPSRMRSLVWTGDDAESQRNKRLSLIRQNLEGLFWSRRKTKRPTGAKVHAPKTLVVTLESDLEDRIGAYGKYLRKRVHKAASDEEEDLGLQIISSQIHDLGGLESSLDEEEKILLRKHIIYWKSALSMPKRKMMPRDYGIPLAATKEYVTPMTKKEVIWRRIKRACCPSFRKEVLEDLVTRESLQEFAQRLHEAEQEEASQHTTMSVAMAQRLERRRRLFDAEAPAYAFAMK